MDLIMADVLDQASYDNRYIPYFLYLTRMYLNISRMKFVTISVLFVHIL